jgi:hypothetical protein
VRLAVSRGPNKVGVFFASPEEGHRSSLRNVMFCGYLQFQTMDKIGKPSDSECYTSLSETFAFKFNFPVGKCISACKERDKLNNPCQNLSYDSGNREDTIS